MVEYPQTDCNMLVFLNSMFSRLIGKVVIRFLYVGMVLYIDMRVITDFLTIRKHMPEIVKKGPSSLTVLEP